MDSKYAYVNFLKGISETDTTKDGKLVQFNYPIYEGETNLMSVSEFKMFERDFPDRIKGNIIKQDHLMSIINLLYDQLKKDVVLLPEIDNYTKSRFEVLKDFERGGVLKPDHETESSINDLANKVFILQEQVRKNQRENIAKNSHHR